MNPETLKLISLVLFLATYAALLLFPRIRAYIALVSAAAFVFLGVIPLEKALLAINWNVIMMIAGTMGTVSLFIESKMPARMADAIIERMPNVKWTVIALSLFSGVISAFVDNVATVLMVAPIALDIAKKLRISPVPAVIAIAVASNLQGAATLVGDTTSILLGGYAGMRFTDFFFFRGQIGMFFIVQAGALVSTLVLLLLFRRDTQPIRVSERTRVRDYVPSYLLAGTVAALIIASFLPNMPALINGYICMGFFLLGLLRACLRKRSLSVFTCAFAEIDFFTLLLLSGLFVVIGGITEVGLVDDISRLFLRISNDPFVMYTMIVWASVLLSAFIDNIPYVATMLPVTTAIAAAMRMDPTLFYFGLLAGATLGGNLTPIGASANITGLGILRRAGYDVRAAAFMKISVPFTLTAVFTGYVLIWLLYT